MFWKPQKNTHTDDGRSSLRQSGNQFGYLSPSDHYFDTACQTLRPQSVIDAEGEYYTQANACGGRASYPWAQRVDRRVEEVRADFLALLGLSSKEYLTFFGLNTTQGINTLLWALPWESYDTIITTEIEHNSVFLPVMKLASHFDKKRYILDRDTTGNVLYEKKDLSRAVVILNTTSNMDGRVLANREELIRDVHSQ